MSSENWLPIPGFSKYRVSDLGRIMRISAGPGSRTGLIMKARKINGYLRIKLSDDEGVVREKGVHFFVATAFHGQQPSPLHEPAHGDGCRSNNWAGTLRWATKEDNWADRYLHGTDATGVRNGRAKLTEEQVRAIKEELRSPNRREFRDIARQYGVSHALIGHINRGRLWSHV